MQVDQQICSWLLATISHDFLVEVRDLLHSYQIWDHLHQWFMTASMARCLELKRSLTTIRKDKSQSMEAYLRSIKVIVDSLAAINSPLSDQELVQFALFSLYRDYESLVTAATYFGGNLTFHDLHDKLLLYEQRVLQIKEHAANPIMHQALATNTASSSITSTNNNWRGNTIPNRGGHDNSWGDGRGRS